MSVTEQVATAFVDGDAGTILKVCADDVLLDAVVPTWRFQLQGHDGLREALAEEFVPGRRVTESHVTPTRDGVLVEIEAWAPMHGEDRMWREIVHFRVADDVVTEIVLYCSGIWDAATIARQAVEAPMLRPR
jgi:hypothetical protein